MTLPTRRSARRVVIAGLVILVLGGVMMVLGSGLPPADERSPYATAIVALELVGSPGEVFRILGPVAGPTRDVLSTVVALDFAVLATYPLLALACVAFLTRARGLRVLAAALSVAMVLGDALENRALFGLLALTSADAPEATGLLASVALWTAVKWSALFASAAMTAMLLLTRGGIGRVLAAVPLLAAATGAVGLVWPAHRSLIEVAGVFGLGATWAIVVVLAIIELRTRRPRR